MSDIIFLDPQTPSPASVTELAQACKANLMTHLKCRIVDEVLRPDEDNETFRSKYSNWLDSPAPKISVVDSLGVKTLQFETTNYTLDTGGGSVTFGSAVTDTVVADFEFFPFNDSQLAEITEHSLIEIANLCWRDINPDSIDQVYTAAICKRLYTNVLKSLVLEARDYFSVSVSGRTIDKTNVETQINNIITQNEEQLMPEIEVLRYYNRSKRMVPSLEYEQTIQSDAEVS